MITSYSINTTHKHQYKLHNSKNIARNLRAICPIYRAHLKQLQNSETPDKF